jgi:single-strand DNA-binding protein
MANFNKVLLMGNLTRDPQLSYTPNQTAVVDFGLAVNRKWKGQDGESKEEVCFVDCRAFSRLAENINKYMRKGRPLFVEGRLVYEQWTAQDGSKRSKHRIHVDNCQFLGGPPAGPAGANRTEQEVSEKSPEAEEGGGNSTGTDDIPF